jgi:hypothetical protein
MNETSKSESEVSCSKTAMEDSTNTVAGSEENRTESETERSRLTQLEEIIEREERSDAHLAIGNALKEINEDKLYRVAGFRAFGRYTKKRFGYHVTYAYRLINYAKEVEKCIANGDTPPTSEGSFRASKQKQKVAQQSETDRPAGQPPKAAPKQKRTQRKSAVKKEQPEQPERIPNELEEEPENVRIINTGPDEEFEGFKDEVEAWKAEFPDDELRPLLEQVKEYIDEILASLPEQELEEVGV